MLVARLAIPTLALAAAFATSAARAADYSPPQPQPPIVYQQPQVEVIASGWYLRGDIGFSNQQVRNLFNPQDLTADTFVNVDKGFDSAPLFGIGIGYYFNDWLRFDVTGEYRGKANFHGMDIYSFAGSFHDDTYSASKSEWTFLLNGYVDLGTWYSVTPFVGAGVGFSRNTISSFRDVGVSTGSDAYADTASKWSFAWALHAGLAYKVSKNFTVELAYRYIDLGNAVTGNAITFDGNVFPAFEFQHLTSHDIKLGLRFNLDGFAEYSRPVQYYQPPPVYTPPPVYLQPPPPLRSRG